jgi:hypothetical protein
MSFLIILIIHAEEYKLQTSSLCSFLHPPVTSFVFVQNIILSTLFLNTLSVGNSMALVREQTTLTEQPPPFGEVSANF